MLDSSGKKINEGFKGKETDLVNQILEYFHWSNRYHLFRCNSGLARALYGTSVVHLAPKGTPDIIGFDKQTGAFIGIETKVKKNTLTIEQAEFGQMLEKTTNGIYILARSLDDCLDVLEPRDPLPF